jgi:hypothetical protein
MEEKSGLEKTGIEIPKTRGWNVLQHFFDEFMAT